MTTNQPRRLNYDRNRTDGWELSQIHEYDEGWLAQMELSNLVDVDLLSASLYVDICTDNFYKTEELAELYAIIQAIEWERNQ